MQYADCLALSLAHMNYAKETSHNKVKTKRPAPPHAWKPGQSGNPGGRPKSRPVTNILKEIFADAKMVSEIKERICKTLTERGMAGVILFDRVADRLEGKVPDETIITDARDLPDDELLAELETLRAAGH